MEYNSYKEYSENEEPGDLTINIHMEKYCPYSCQHCMYASGPQQSQEVLDLKVLGWIEEQFGGGYDSWKDRFNGICVNMVGGEPVYQDLSTFDWHFHAIMETLSSCDMSWEMTTNGWWLEDPKNARRVIQTMAPHMEHTDTYVRISDSPWHEEHRSEALNRIFKGLQPRDTAGHYGEADTATPFQNLLDEAMDYWGDIDDIEVSVDSDHPDYDEEYVDACDRLRDSLPYHIPGSENFYVDSIGRGKYGKDPLSNISASGRGLKLGGYQEPTCRHWYEEPKLTILPNGDVRDFCCNGGGLVRQGKVWDRSIDEWMEIMHSFYKHLDGCGADCAACPKNTRDWVAKQSKKGTPSLILI